MFKINEFRESLWEYEQKEQGNKLKTAIIFWILIISFASVCQLISFAEYV